MSTYVCERCGAEYKEATENDWGGTISINGGDPIHLCGSCLFKVHTLLQKTDYEWIRDALTRTGYDKDIEAHDDENYFILNTYGNRVAVEFDSSGEFNLITEAE
jgi:DNA-directed RNA polymerase subunit RPC12/RpoP